MTQFDPQKFSQMVRFMPEPMLQQLILQARKSGIDQSAINEGINYINQIKNPTAAAGQSDNK